jgi:hypothetical protein
VAAVVAAQRELHDCCCRASTEAGAWPQGSASTEQRFMAAGLCQNGGKCIEQMLASTDASEWLLACS